MNDDRNGQGDTGSWNSECTVMETDSPHEQFILYKRLSEVNELVSGSVLSFINLRSANQIKSSICKHLQCACLYLWTCQICWIEWTISWFSESFHIFLVSSRKLGHFLVHYSKLFLTPSLNESFRHGQDSFLTWSFDESFCHYRDSLLQLSESFDYDWDSLFIH